MKDIRWNTFWFFLIQFFLYLFISKIISKEIALIILCGSLMLSILINAIWMHKLNTWLSKPSIEKLPQGTGGWESIFSKIYQDIRTRRKSKKNLATTIDQFILASDALLDGIIVLNETNEIAWANKRAKTMFGIDSIKDKTQPIQYIFRNTEFTAYLDAEEYDQPIHIKTKNIIEDIEIRIISFGKLQKLIIGKDISVIIKNESIRKEFVSNFSHELKTPLTVITGFIETLDSSLITDKPTKQIFNLMMEQSTRMKQLIDDLLLLSNVESSLIKNRSEKINSKKLFEKIKKNIKLVDKGKHKIIYKINHELNIYGSKQEIESAFTNLITNAIRYTANDKMIHINWNVINDIPIFEVIDSGIGIEKKHINRITERFYRVDDNRSRSNGGTGLGLSIVKNIMIKHQGELNILSEPNKGSTFKLIFPSDRLIRN